MYVLHVVPGLDDQTNGIAVAAKMIAAGQMKAGAEVEVVEAKEFILPAFNPKLRFEDEVWVHSMWLPQTMLACWKVIRARGKLVRMTHSNLDPLRYCCHGWKKRLVAPIERWLFRRTDRVVATCEAERTWCRKWGLRNEFEVVDLKKYFDLDKSKSGVEQRNLHILYLGRRHPLKGVEFLEKAVASPLELRIVSNHFGEELEKDWEWCDVLCLPTLSDNFGLVVAEALERGKRVVTTDGAPAWGEGESFDHLDFPDCSVGFGGRLIYLKGYRDGTDEDRVRLLKEAIMRFAD